MAPIIFTCPHDGVELELSYEEKKTSGGRTVGFGIIICPKCKCKFRLCLANFDPKCYKKMYPNFKKLPDISEYKGE